MHLCLPTSHQSLDTLRIKLIAFLAPRLLISSPLEIFLTTEQS
jgi:hypothetical protein